MKLPHFGITKTGHHVHLNTNDYHRDGSRYQRFNKWCAVWVTKNVGTMTAFWIFTALSMMILPSCLYAAKYISWNSFITSFGFELLATLILSTWLELALMPAIMVGQNLQSLASDARSAKQFEDTETIVDALDLSTQGGLKVIYDEIQSMKGNYVSQKAPESGSVPVSS